MLKHVSYRSTSSLGRGGELPSCRGSSVSPDTISLKGTLPRSPELALKGDMRPSPDTVSLRSPDTMSLRSPDTMSLRSPDTISLRSPDTMSLKDDVSLKSFRHHPRSPDTISLHSALSFSSLAPSRLSSRCSSTVSLNDQPTTPVKVYLRALRPDIEYKTVSLTYQATCKELVAMLLTKYRMKHRDPNLFFVTMELTVRVPGGASPVRRLLVLEDSARPAELQECHPRGDSRFSLGVRRGGLVRVHDSILMAGSQYKSVLLSYRTSAEELVQVLLNCYNNKESPKHYAIHEVCRNPYNDRQLRPEEFPLLVQAEWPKTKRAEYTFVLRRNIAYALSLKTRMSWRHSLDQSSTDTESEHEDHNTTSASLLSSDSASSTDSTSSSSLSPMSPSATLPAKFTFSINSNTKETHIIPVTTPSLISTTPPTKSEAPAEAGSSKGTTTTTTMAATSTTTPPASANPTLPSSATTTTISTTPVPHTRPFPAPRTILPPSSNMPNISLLFISPAYQEGCFSVAPPRRPPPPPPPPSPSPPSSPAPPAVPSTRLTPKTPTEVTGGEVTLSTSTTSSNASTVTESTSPATTPTETPPSSQLGSSHSSCCHNYENCFFI